MSQLPHTYGPTCHLVRSVGFSGDDDMPGLKAQFFYSSALPIDDPLSAVPIRNTSDPRAANYPSRPFSAYDNNALEEAWLGLASEKDRRNHKRAVSPKPGWRRLIDSRIIPNGNKRRSSEVTTPPIVVRLCTGGVSGSQPDGIKKPNEADPPLSGGKVKQPARKKFGISETIHGSVDGADSPSSSRARPDGPVEGDGSITGSPFAKLPAREEEPQGPSAFTSGDGHADRLASHGDSTALAESSQRAEDHDPAGTETLRDSGCKAHKNTSDHVDVPVGVSRLHLVKLPSLQMEPIYWSPVHDICAVTRATWFYKDTMNPVEPRVANQLEMGYRELRPWSRTWNDELNSAIEVGAAGEEKISHGLWPKEENKVDAGSDVPSASGEPGSIITSDPHCAARCFHGEAAAEGFIAEDESGKPPEAKPKARRFSNYHVIYKDAQNAFLLKPTLQPSAYYGRKPLQKIRRGIPVGIRVVRGFDWRAWDKIHPPKKAKVAIRPGENAPVAGDANANKRNACPACQSQEERPNVTDLALVIHGIGQKLSERVESFHFTHATNAFRRSVNVELGNDAVQNVLRSDLGGVMVLPVNWRSTLSFEDGGPMREGDQDPVNSRFSLKDITPDSIPAVRNLISDVMLDIPFYMSHHKPKMIAAATMEANRIYRLWCKNNPGFHENGRVHVIAHSLGSVMAVDILSRQPTLTPKTELEGRKINSKHFDFDTTNLFIAGSPVGFFLHLEKGNLTPRLNQSKPGAEPGDDKDRSITGSAGTFGCLAVDNIYNVMDLNDPIAYRLNATVDPQYATALKDASVPSATTSLFESIGHAMKSITPGVAAPADLSVGQLAAPTLARLPSQLEMAVHDFTREEMAERKFSLLNDNGQVDWFLRSGGGPLDIQYLNMLGAHSSYWTSHDFVRMLVTELGRRPGKQHTLPNMRAAKIGHKT